MLQASVSSQKMAMRFALVTSARLRVSFILRDLHGFSTAVTPSGLTPLQVHGEDSRSSTWFGSPDGPPISNRLNLSMPILAISVDVGVSVYDPVKRNWWLTALQGFRIVGLGVVLTGP